MLVVIVSVVVISVLLLLNYFIFDKVVVVVIRWFNKYENKINIMIIEFVVGLSRAMHKILCFPRSLLSYLQLLFLLVRNQLIFHFFFICSLSLLFHSFSLSLLPIINILFL